jgi:hypothetical protein
MLRCDVVWNESTRRRSKITVKAARYSAVAKMPWLVFVNEPLAEVTRRSARTW